MLNAAQCCVADAEWQNQWPVALHTIEVTSKWCTFKLNLSHFNAVQSALVLNLASLHFCLCSNIHLDNFTVAL